LAVPAFLSAKAPSGEPDALTESLASGVTLGVPVSAAVVPPS
jgi:hypothetical protein